MGARLDEYELLSQIGEGGMGVVHAARDTLLDRVVAIKLLARRWSSEEERARVIREARALARIDHPNVVRVFRAGEHEGRPYIVSELVRGELLREVAKPMAAERVIELGAALARGLAAIHRRGVLHCDIKPSNVMLGEDGEPKILDFGIAELIEDDQGARAEGPREMQAPAPKTVPGAPLAAAGRDETARPPPVFGIAGGDETADSPARPLAVAAAAAPPRPARPARRRGFAGTPRYAAPEVWRGEPASTRSDIYSLGVVLYELISASTPYEDVPLEQLGRTLQERASPPVLASPHAALAAIITRCLARDPHARFPSADALRDALEELRAAHAAPLIPGVNPYRGLLAFEAEDRRFYFGRERELRLVLDRLRDHRFVVIAGDSGTGKSSLVRAGVLPAIAEGELQRPVASTAITTPNRRGLTRALAELAGLDESAAAALIDTPDEALRRVEHHADGKIAVLFVDQLEELITTGDRAEAEKLAAFLTIFARDSRATRLIATVRSSHIGKLAELGVLAVELSRSLVLLAAPPRDALRRAIVGPARVSGASFESEALVESLISAAEDRPAALPLLQFTLRELWERREHQVITRAALEEIGGVEGCLARHGDEVIRALAPNLRDVARRVLLRLVSAEGLRIPRRLSELRESTPEAEPVVLALISARLLVERETIGGDALVELAHESLATFWFTLAQWLTEARQELELRARVERTAREWQRLGRPEELLLAAPQLAELDRLELGELEKTFLTASRRRLNRRRAGRVALFAGLPLLLAIAAAPSLMSWYSTKTAAELYRRDGEEHARSAQVKEAEASVLARRALAAMDAGDTGEGEALWQKARALIAETKHDSELAIRAWSRSSDLIRDAAIETSIVELLFTRASVAESEFRRREAKEWRALLAARPAGRGALQRLDAPATLAIETDPPGRAVEMLRYGLVEGRWLITSTVALAQTPAAVETDPGSIVLLAGEVRHPHWVRPGTAEKIIIKIPARVPPGFIYIPEGKFLFGTDQDETTRTSFLQTSPLHERTIGAYLIARHEVTFAEWIEFLRAQPPARRRALMPRAQQMLNGIELVEEPGGQFRLHLEAAKQKYSAREGEPIIYLGRSRHREQDWRKMPVAGISLQDAEAHVAWLRDSGRVPKARLCSELEWERAARGADGRTHPGAEEPAPFDQNVDVTYGRVTGAFGPDEVGSHPASRSPFGVDDAGGNVWEWVRGRDTPLNKGGCWYFSLRTAQAANREPSQPDHRDPLLGLRICADP